MPRAKKFTNIKLSQSQIQKACQLIAEGMTISEAALELGLDAGLLRASTAVQDAAAAAASGAAAGAAERVLAALPGVVAGLAGSLASLAEQRASLVLALGGLKIGSKEYAIINSELKTVDSNYSQYLTKYHQMLQWSLTNTRMQPTEETSDLKDRLMAELAEEPGSVVPGELMAEPESDDDSEG